MSTTQRRWFYYSLVASLLLHVSSYVSLKWVPRPRAPLAEEIEVTILDPKDRADLPTDAQQIVDQSEKPLNDEVPKDTKYLSRNNQRVEKETRAAAHGAFANRDNGTPQPAQNTPPKPTSAKKEVASDQPKDAGAGPVPKLKDLTHKYSWHTQDTAAQAGRGLSTTDDYLKDKATGNETLLNTREFVYFSYYSRIKERLRMYWEPKIKGKMQRILAQGRKLASDQDHITRVIITLDSQGTLVRVQVVGESGVRDLDDAAIEAFQAAAPFPNPPKGIVESDGTIKIRWDFVLEAQNAADFTRSYAAQKEAERRPRYYR